MEFVLQLGEAEARQEATRGAVRREGQPGSSAPKQPASPGSSPRPLLKQGGRRQAARHRVPPGVLSTDGDLTAPPGVWR